MCEIDKNVFKNFNCLVKMYIYSGNRSVPILYNNFISIKSEDWLPTKGKVSNNVNSEKLKGYRKKKYKKQKKNYGSCTWVGNVTTLFTVNIHLILGNFIYTIYEH